MSEPTKEHNRSMSWRPLLLNSGGPRRVAKSYPEGEKQDHVSQSGAGNVVSRNENSLPSRKRSYSTFVNAGYGRESAIPSNRLSDSPKNSHSARDSLDGESRRQSSRSSRSSYSEDRHSLMLPPTHDIETVKQNEVKLPKNLQDVIQINGKTYIKLKRIGVGGSSVVYRVINEKNEVLALKCVNLKEIAPSLYNDYVNEVKLLETLRGSPGIIYLVDYELNKSEQQLYILMECGETDLKSYLNTNIKQNLPIDMNFIRLTWQQMLTAVNVIHHHNIIHSDLKPANFLFVKGNLKLIDFGIARTMAEEATSALRESQMGSVNYIAPEALRDVGSGNGHKGIRIRRSTDVWSLGVILYQMVYQRLPWGDLPLNKVVLAILQESYVIPFPPISNPWLLDTLKGCLQRDPNLRPTIDGENGLLSHPFLEPQGMRARYLYKQMTVDTEVMRETIRQIHASSGDERWKREGIIPLVTDELAIQCARKKPIDVLAALTSAEKKL